MRKEWSYAQTPGTRVGLMICTGCNKPITDGDFRYRETEEAYLPQHRACCASDPHWGEVDTKREDNNFSSWVLEKLRDLVSDIEHGLNPTELALQEQIFQYLRPKFDKDQRLENS